MRELVNTLQWNVLLHGIPESSGEYCHVIVENLLSQNKMKNLVCDLEGVAHRLPTNRDMKKHTNHIRPIIFRMYSRPSVQRIVDLLGRQSVSKGRRYYCTRHKTFTQLQQDRELWRQKQSGQRRQTNSLAGSNPSVDNSGFRYEQSQSDAGTSS